MCSAIEHTNTSGTNHFSVIYFEPFFLDTIDVTSPYTPHVHGLATLLKCISTYEHLIQILPYPFTFN